MARKLPVDEAFARGEARVPDGGLWLIAPEVCEGVPLIVRRQEEGEPDGLVLVQDVLYVGDGLLLGHPRTEGGDRLRLDGVYRIAGGGRYGGPGDGGLIIFTTPCPVLPVGVGVGPGYRLIRCRVEVRDVREPPAAAGPISTAPAVEVGV